MSGCDAAVYTNSGVCYHQLSNWQQCALGETTTTVSVDMNGTSVSSRETKASMYISMIRKKPSYVLNFIHWFVYRCKSINRVQEGSHSICVSIDFSSL